MLWANYIDTNKDFFIYYFYYFKWGKSDQKWKKYMA